jgi:hypothetical protein
LSDDEFLQMIPAALELLMRRLQVWDRKALHGAAMICAETWNSAGMSIDRKKRPEGFVPKDFLPETHEDRREREAAEEEARQPPSKEQIEQFKASLMALHPRQLASSS